MNRAHLKLTTAQGIRQAPQGFDQIVVINPTASSLELALYDELNAVDIVLPPFSVWVSCIDYYRGIGWRYALLPAAPPFARVYGYEGSHFTPQLTQWTA